MNFTSRRHRRGAAHGSGSGLAYFGFGSSPACRLPRQLNRISLLHYLRRILSKRTRRFLAREKLPRPASTPAGLALRVWQWYVGTDLQVAGPAAGAAPPPLGAEPRPEAVKEHAAEHDLARGEAGLREGGGR